MGQDSKGSAARGHMLGDAHPRPAPAVVLSVFILSSTEQGSISPSAEQLWNCQNHLLTSRLASACSLCSRRPARSTPSVGFGWVNYRYHRERTHKTERKETEGSAWLDSRASQGENCVKLSVQVDLLLPFPQREGPRPTPSTPWARLSLWNLWKFLSVIVRS